MPNTPAQPFLKWAGGKRQLLPQLVRHVRRLCPKGIVTYYEPFLGGGALFFELSNRGWFNFASLTDRNAALIEAYAAVKSDTEGLFFMLDELQAQVNPEGYARLRDEFNAMLSRREDERTGAKWIGRGARRKAAALLIYLNKAGFNGLYRVNRKGQFNSPYGKADGRAIYDRRVILADHAALFGVDLGCADFETRLNPEPGDLVYFDPPYLPASKTANFESFQAEKFGINEHQRLACLMFELRAKGVDAICSNADVPEARRIFGPAGQGLKLHRVKARRSMNSAGDKRGPVGELIITTR